MADPAASSAGQEPKPPKPKKPPAGGRNGEGPGRGHVHVRGISLTALYLIAAAAFSLYVLVRLWPHPTPTGDPLVVVTAESEGAGDNTARGDKIVAAPGSVPVPKPEEGPDGDVAQRQGRLCGKDDVACRACVRQEMQLQYESQRRNDPQCTYIFGGYHAIWQEARLLLLVLLAGAIGALLHAIRSLVAHVGNRNFVASWFAFYFLAPFSGAMIAFVAYIAVRGGFFASTATTMDANPFMFIAFATLAGLFSHEVMEKLRKVAETAFEKAPPGKNPLAVSKPVIDSIDPDKVEVGSTEELEIDGSGFVDGSVVRVDGTLAKSSRVNDKQITFVLPDGAAAAPKKLSIVVATPAPDGGASDPATIEVVEAAGG